MPAARRSIGGRAAPWLLVSVTGPEEAEDAFDGGGADLIDLKDPRRGALGACDLDLLRAVATLRDRRSPATPLSAALGAAGDPRAPDRAARVAALGYDFVKLGLENLPALPAAAAALARIVEAVRATRPATQVIAVTFADAEALPSLPPPLLPEAAKAARASGCLLDTAVKDGRTLLDHLEPALLARFIAACRRRGLLVALAGSLGLETIARLLPLSPDVVGVRGAVCDGGRDGRFAPDRLRSLRAALGGSPGTPFFPATSVSRRPRPAGVSRTAAHRR